MRIRILDNPRKKHKHFWKIPRLFFAIFFNIFSSIISLLDSDPDILGVQDPGNQNVADPVPGAKMLRIRIQEAKMSRIRIQEAKIIRIMNQEAKL